MQREDSGVFIDHGVDTLPGPRARKSSPEPRRVFNAVGSCCSVVLMDGAVR